MKIINSACCPVGEAAGHDADECRANLVEDGSILCVTCATRYPKMSDRMRRVFRAITSFYGTPDVQLGSSTQPGTPAYAASCLCGYDPSQSDLVRAHFNRDRETVSLQYEQANEGELANPDLSIGRALRQEELALMSDRMIKCVSSLESEGFRVRHFQTELGLRVVMSSGRPVGSMGFVLGASIELKR